MATQLKIYSICYMIINLFIFLYFQVAHIMIMRFSYFAYQKLPIKMLTLSYFLIFVNLHGDRVVEFYHQISMMQTIYFKLLMHSKPIT